jgi:hypothetical protein
VRRRKVFKASQVTSIHDSTSAEVLCDAIDQSVEAGLVLPLSMCELVVARACMERALISNWPEMLELLDRDATSSVLGLSNVSTKPGMSDSRLAKLVGKIFNDVLGFVGNPVLTVKAVSNTGRRSEKTLDADSQSSLDAAGYDMVEGKILLKTAEDMAGLLQCLRNSRQDLRDRLTASLPGLDEFSLLCAAAIADDVDEPDQLEAARNTLEANETSAFWKVVHILPLGGWLLAKAAKILASHAKDRGFSLDIAATQKTICSLKLPAFTEWCQLVDRSGEVLCPMTFRWSEVSQKTTLVEERGSKRLLLAKQVQLTEINDTLVKLGGRVSDMLEYRFAQNFKDLAPVLTALVKLSSDGISESEAVTKLLKELGDKWEDFSVLSKIQPGKLLGHSKAKNIFAKAEATKQFMNAIVEACHTVVDAFCNKPFDVLAEPLQRLMGISNEDPANMWQAEGAADVVQQLTAEVRIIAINRITDKFGGGVDFAIGVGSSLEEAPDAVDLCDCKAKAMLTARAADAEFNFDKFIRTYLVKYSAESKKTSRLSSQVKLTGLDGTAAEVDCGAACVAGMLAPLAKKSLQLQDVATRAKDAQTLAQRVPALILQKQQTKKEDKGDQQFKTSVAARLLELELQTCMQSVRSVAALQEFGFNYEIIVKYLCSVVLRSLRCAFDAVCQDNLATTAELTKLSTGTLMCLPSLVAAEGGAQVDKITTAIDSADAAQLYYNWNKGKQSADVAVLVLDIMAVLLGDTSPFNQQDMLQDVVDLRTKVQKQLSGQEPETSFQVSGTVLANVTCCSALYRPPADGETTATLAKKCQNGLSKKFLVADATIAAQLAHAQTK